MSKPAENWLGGLTWLEPKPFATQLADEAKDSFMVEQMNPRALWRLKKSNASLGALNLPPRAPTRVSLVVKDSS